MLPSYNSNNHNFDAFSNNLSIYNNTSAQQNNINNINDPHNYNQQRVVYQYPNQGARCSDANVPLNDVRSTHQKNQVVNTNGIIPIVLNTSYSQNNKQIISNQVGINSPQISNNNNFQSPNNNNIK